MTILMVDDEPILRQSVGILLKRLNPQINVIEARDGYEALEKLKQSQCDAIITDVRMPGMDGMALIQIVNEQYPDIQIVILTGYAEFDYARKALQCGATDYLLKPVRFDELRKVVERIQSRYERLAAARLQPVTKSDQSIESIIADACDYIRDHYDENLSLSNMGERFFLNASYFCEQFAKHSGRSFVEYLTDARMEAAVRLFEDQPDLSITDVSLRTGYADARYFGQVFRKRYGITPSEYKKKKRNA